jgi:GNAT superfamily N-acetyltransferase
MDFQVRIAREEDIPLILPWTQDTFEWGDYIPDRLPDWIADPDSVVLVVVDSEDRPWAITHALMLSGDEGWLEGARVHPDHRRRGLGKTLNEVGVAWLKDQGARVVGLAAEADNEPVHLQMEQLGYRAVSRWLHAELAVPGDEICPPGLHLRRAVSADVDAAWMFWSTSDLAHEGRGMIAEGWHWRKARPDDLAAGAARGGFFQAPTGWVLIDQPGEDRVRLLWMATTRADAPRLLEALMDLARGRGAEMVSVKVPKIPWVAETLIRAGAEPGEVVVYWKAV